MQMYYGDRSIIVPNEWRLLLAQPVLERMEISRETHRTWQQFCKRK